MAATAAGPRRATSSSFAESRSPHATRVRSFVAAAGLTITARPSSASAPSSQTAVGQRVGGPLNPASAAALTASLVRAAASQPNSSSSSSGGVRLLHAAGARIAPTTGNRNLSLLARAAVAASLVPRRDAAAAATTVLEATSAAAQAIATRRITMAAATPAPTAPAALIITGNSRPPAQSGVAYAPPPRPQVLVPQPVVGQTRSARPEAAPPISATHNVHRLHASQPVLPGEGVITRQGGGGALPERCAHSEV